MSHQFSSMHTGILGSEILPLTSNSKDELENDLASSMSTTASIEAQEEEPPQPPLKSFAKTLWRTRLCKHYLKGTCRYGSNCGFAHSDDNVNDRPDLVKTRLCSRFQKGFCTKGDKCQFAHGLAELKVVDIVSRGPKSEVDKVKHAKSTTEKESIAEKGPRNLDPCYVEPMKCPLQPMKCPLPSTAAPPPLNGFRHLVNDVLPHFVGPQDVPPTRLQPGRQDPPQVNRWQEVNMPASDQSKALAECQRLRQSLLLEEPWKDDVWGPCEDGTWRPLNRPLPGQSRRTDDIPTNSLLAHGFDVHGKSYVSRTHSTMASPMVQKNVPPGYYSSNMEGFNTVPYGDKHLAKYDFEKIRAMDRNVAPGAMAAPQRSRSNMDGESLFANVWLDC